MNIIESHQQPLEVGNLITAYHKGFHEIVSISPDKVTIGYRMIYDSNGKVKRTNTIQWCSLTYCQLAKYSIQEEIKKHQNIIDNLQKII